MRRVRSLRAMLLAGLTTLVLCWLLVVGMVLYFAEPTEPRPADAIVVLGAAQYNGRPSPVLKARLDHALALWRRGLAPRLIFTGGVGRRDTLSEAEVARRYAVARGVPDSAIMLERHGHTSAESMGAAAAIMEEEGLERALIVSDPFHMLRLLVLARRAGLTPQRAPTPTSAIVDRGALYWRYVLRESILVPLALLQGPQLNPETTETGG